MGRSLIEMANDLNADPDMTVERLREIARNPKSHPRMAGAAKQLLQMAMHATLADFESLQDGKTLKDLEAQGVPIELLKRRKRTEKTVTNKDGVSETTVTYELEMQPLEVAGTAFDRLGDRTDGKPVQSMVLDATVNVPTGITMNVVGPALPKGEGRSEGG